MMRRARGEPRDGVAPELAERALDALLQQDANFLLDAQHLAPRALGVGALGDARERRIDERRQRRRGNVARAAWTSGKSWRSELRSR